MITSLDDLTSAEAREAAEVGIAAAVADLPSGLRQEVAAELAAHLCEELDADSDELRIRALVALFGPVEAEPSGWRGALDRLVRGFDPAGVAARLAESMWQPADERLLLPRAVGLGWDLNLGAVAVRLGLIEPDAEDEPFTSTRPAAFRQASVLPAAMAVAVAAHYLARWRTLQQRLPGHWNLFGRPDRWTSRSSAAVIDLGTTLGPAVLAAWAARSDRPGPDKAGVIAGSALIASVGAVTTVARSLPEGRGWWIQPALVIGSAAAAGATLIHLALDGRRAEISRDLPGQ